MGTVGEFPGSSAPRITPPSPLCPDHDCSRFDCGNELLNKRLATAHVNEGRTARTYVVCSGTKVIGYYRLATGAVKRQSLPKKIRQGNPDPVPVMLIGRLAVDQAFQGKGIGPGLLRDALLRIAGAAEVVGCRAVLVQAIDGRAAAFYSTADFIAFPSGSRTMFLPIETLEAVV